MEDYELLKTAAALDAAKKNDINTLAELFVMDLDDDTKVALANALEKEAEWNIFTGDPGEALAALWERIFHPEAYRAGQITPQDLEGIKNRKTIAAQRELIKKLKLGAGGAAGAAGLAGLLAAALALRGRARGGSKLVSLLRKVRPR